MKKAQFCGKGERGISVQRYYNIGLVTERISYLTNYENSIIYFNFGKLPWLKISQFNGFPAV